LIQLFPQVLLSNLKKYNKDGQLKDASAVFNQTYQEVDQLLIKFEYEGSTATTLLIWKTADGKRYFQCANLGDSSAFLCRDSGDTIALSEDHKVTSLPERKRLEELGITLSPFQTHLNSLAVTRAFGDHFAKSIDFGMIAVPYISKVIEITPADKKIILASDGLWDVFSAKQAYDIIKSIKESKQAAHKLTKSAVRKPKCNDNVTVIVINLRS